MSIASAAANKPRPSGKAKWPPDNSGGLLLSGLAQRLACSHKCPMQTLALFFTAALFEIAGCYAVWAWWRLGQSALWLLPGGISLALFAWTLTLVNVDFAGRAYAVYGGIYIVSSIL